MTHYVVLDIETIPHPDAHSWASPVKPDSRLVDPEKIKGDIAKKVASQADEFGLDPDSCRMVALGFHIVGQSDPDVFLMRDEFEERHLLMSFLERLAKLHSYRLVTFNGLKFDLPILMRRAM